MRILKHTFFARCHQVPELVSLPMFGHGNLYPPLSQTKISGPEETNTTSQSSWLCKSPRKPVWRWYKYQVVWCCLINNISCELTCKANKKNTGFKLRLAAGTVHPPWAWDPGPWWTKIHIKTQDMSSVQEKEVGGIKPIGYMLKWELESYCWNLEVVEHHLIHGWIMWWFCASGDLFKTCALPFHLSITWGQLNIFKQLIYHCRRHFNILRYPPVDWKNSMTFFWNIKGIGLDGETCI